MSNPNVTIDRNKYIGGSDLPTILGLNSKYGTNIFEFAKEKIGILPKSFSGNQFTKYGQLMEPIIRDYINAKYNANYLEDTGYDNDKNYRGNTDGIDVDAEYPIIEIKTFGEELDVEYYTAQCQFYMEIFNQPKCLLVGYKRPNNFYTGIDYNLENDNSYFNLEFDVNNIVTHVIKRDKNLWLKIEKRIEAFKNALEALKLNNNMTEEEFNKNFYGNEIIETSNKIMKLENTLNNYKKLESDYKNLKERLYQLFEDNNILSLDNGKIKITKVSPVSYDTVTIDSSKLKEDHEEIYNQYKVTKTVNKKGYILITKNKEVDVNVIASK